MSRKHAHNVTIKATPQSKTAQYANPRHSKPTKQERNLASRIADHARGPQAADRDKQQSRWDAGGFKKPGSLQ